MLTVSACLFLLAGGQAYAQKTITGKVTDKADGTGLPGVNISVKGTTNGTSSSADGTYSLANVPDNAVLVFSFVGYNAQEIIAGNQTTLDVVLSSDVKALEEVVVVGYGTQQKKDVTGGVVALTAKDFNQGQIASPEQLLQGRAAGVQITPSSGDPGAAQTVRIRGAFSVRGNSNPLYVVDGVPLSNDATNDGSNNSDFGSSSARNPLTFLNPADIENITVLKDASASAIYGSRAGNGVILITTKKGKSGQQSFNFNASTGISSTLKRYKLLSSDEYSAAWQKANNTTATPPATINAGGSTDWQDESFRTGVQQNYGLNYGGGNDNTRYFMSLSYSDIQGIVKGSDLSRISARVNASHELFNDKVKIELQFSTSRNNDQFATISNNAGYQGSLLGAAYQANPTYPVYDSQGRYFTPSGYDVATGNVNSDSFRNPVSLIKGVLSYGHTNTTIGNISGTWRIIGGLSYKMNFGVTNSEGVRTGSVDPNLPGLFGTTNNMSNTVGVGYVNNRSTNSMLIEHTLNYNEKVGIGQLDAVIGYAYQNFRNDSYYSQAGNYFEKTSQPILENIGAVNALNPQVRTFFVSQDGSKYDIQSVFGRVNYNILDKYLLTATFRADGSSKFGKNYKYGVFPSFAAAWRISQESFMPQGLFTDLKLRANWGKIGNQDGLPSGSTIKTYNYDSFGGVIPPLYNQNADLQWEATRMYGIGVDFGLLNNRLTGTLDYFNRSSTKAIYYKYVGATAAAPYRWVNLPGELTSKGAEVTLNYEVLKGKALTWNVGFNATYLKTNVKGIDTSGTAYKTGSIDGQGLSGAYSQTFKDGSPAYSFYIPTFSGFNDKGFSVYPTATDPNNTNSDLTIAKPQIQGSALPKWVLGLSNNLGYKNFSLSLFFTASTGFYVYNNTANALFYKAALKNGKNVTQDAANSNEDGTNLAAVSTRFLEKGDFLRLSNATLGYTFKLPTSAIKSLRLTLTGQNLFLVTKYKGLDPEVSVNKAINGIASQGIDYTAIPNPRTFLIGLSAGF